MKSWIHLSRGTVPPQAHVNVSQLGDDIKEDELGRGAFAGRVAELYRRNEPTGWTRIEGNMQPCDFNAFDLEPTDYNDARGGPLRLFHNADAAIWISRRQEAMPYCARNADGDEIHFVHEGTGTFVTEFGPIPYEPGDYVVIPKACTYHVVPDGKRNFFFIIETAGEVSFADIGPIGRHAPFDPTLLFIPTPPAAETVRTIEEEWEVRIRFRGEYTSVFYPFYPIDVIGWKGDLFPFKINIRDYRALHSDRIHIMPTAFGIFSAPGVVICNFLPRRAEGEREVERVPPYHRNVDYDELMFCHGNRIMNAGFEPGTITHLPQGLHHGLPAEMAKQIRDNWRGDDFFDQKLIAVDTVQPFIVSAEARALSKEIDQVRGAKIAG